MMAVIKVLTIYTINLLVSQRMIPQELADQLFSNPEARLWIEMAVATVLTAIFTSMTGFLQLIPAAMNKGLEWAKKKLGVRHGS